VLRTLKSVSKHSQAAQKTDRKSESESEINLGCLHPVAHVRSDDVGFNPSTQRHYRRLIYYLYITY
jgi:hypothetical protein